MVPYDYVHHVPEDLLNSQYECRVASVSCGGVFQPDDVAVMTLTVKNFMQNILSYIVFVKSTARYPTLYL